MENLVIDQIEKKNYKNQTKCLFFPNQNSYKFYIQVLKQCKRILIVCMYQISHKKLVNILLQLSERDINVQLLVYCNSKDSRQMSILQGILKNSLERIKIAIFTSDSRLMHSKFCVIDDEIVLVGSANWTNFAFKKNHESVVIIENVQRAQEFTKQFQHIWKNCQLLSMRMMNFQLTPIEQIGQKRRNRQNKTLEKCAQMIESLIEIPPQCESFEEQKDSDDVECLQKFGSPSITYIYNDQKDSTNKINELLSKHLIQLINSDDECSVDNNNQENDIEILL